MHFREYQMRSVNTSMTKEYRVIIGAGAIVIGKIKVGNNVSKKTNHT